MYKKRFKSHVCIFFKLGVHCTISRNILAMIIHFTVNIRDSKLINYDLIRASMNTSDSIYNSSLQQHQSLATDAFTFAQCDIGHCGPLLTIFFNVFILLTKNYNRYSLTTSTVILNTNFQDATLFSKIGFAVARNNKNEYIFLN